MKSKRLLPLAAVLCGWFTAAQPAFAQTTAFTYQGRLTDGGAPANGANYGMVFYLYDAPTNGALLGNLGVASVTVSNGLFTVPLDFGNEFDGNPRWLEITVQKNGGAFIRLSPRQPLTATPYAITAAGISGALPAAQLSGAIANGNLPASPAFSGAVTASSFSGNGANVTNVNAATVGGVSAANLWKLDGNAGTTPGTQFLGTADNQPLEFKVNNQRALRLEPNASSAPNVIGGAPVNFVASGIMGATIAGGGAANYGGISFTNSVSANFGTVGGGYNNTIQTNADHSTIGGGGGNTIQTNATYSTIGGGFGNTIQTNASDSTIGGGDFNTIQTNATYSTIGGGYNNTIQPNAQFATIGGGLQNTIQPNADHSIIGGGVGNTIQTNASDSTIGGGYFNTIQNNAANSTIGGGFGNTIQPSASDSTIGGGYFNTIQTNASDSTIGGGFGNTIQTSASESTIGGGQQNMIQPNAPFATIGGGGGNTIQPNAQFATIPGGLLNSATNYAFAAGNQAKANHTGAFVWGDSNNADIASATNNSVTFRASGGYRLFSNSGATAGVSLAAGGTAWAVISDRNVKKDFAPVDAVDILEKLAALPITQWRYQWEEEAVTPHIGPMAQDFKAAFYPGTDDKSITTQEADGVALAAIQGLNQKLEEQRAENAALKQRLEKLEQLMNGNNGGAK